MNEPNTTQPPSGGAGSASSSTSSASSRDFRWPWLTPLLTSFSFFPPHILLHWNPAMKQTPPLEADKQPMELIKGWTLS